MKKLEIGKNGVISEESLAEIAGGMKISVEDCKNFFKKNGVKIAKSAAIVAGAALAGGAGYAGYKFVKNRGNKSTPQPASTQPNFQTDDEYFTYSDDVLNLSL